MSSRIVRSAARFAVAAVVAGSALGIAPPAGADSAEQTNYFHAWGELTGIRYGEVDDLAGGTPDRLKIVVAGGDAPPNGPFGPESIINVDTAAAEFRDGMNTWGRYTYNPKKGQHVLIVGRRDNGNFIGSLVRRYAYDISAHHELPVTAQQTEAWSDGNGDHCRGQGTVTGGRFAGWTVDLHRTSDVDGTQVQWTLTSGADVVSGYTGYTKGGFDYLPDVVRALLPNRRRTDGGEITGGAGAMLGSVGAAWMEPSCGFLLAVDAGTAPMMLELTFTA